MKTQFEMVGDFHRKFELPVTPAPACASWDRRPPAILDHETFLFRYQFLAEELHELLAAHRRGDLPAAADALADLVYVALGTAHMMGVPFDAVFAEVQRANMGKERASSSSDGRSKRGSALDVVKPEGWKPPDVAGVLRTAGWEGEGT